MKTSNNILSGRFDRLNDAYFKFLFASPERKITQPMIMYLSFGRVRVMILLNL